MKEKTSLFAKIGNWFKNEYCKLKPLNGKQRWEYYKMYYLIPTVVVVFVAIFVIGGIVVGISNSQKETKLYVQLVSSTLADFEPWVDAYEQHRGYADNQSMQLSQGQYYSGSQFYAPSTSVFAATGSLDVLVCEDSNLEAILKMGLASELTGAFTSGLLNENLCYTEYTMVMEYDGLEETEAGYYYVDITGTPFAKMLEIEGNAYLLKCVTTQRHEEVEAFFEYVLTQE